MHRSPGGACFWRPREKVNAPGRWARGAVPASWEVASGMPRALTFRTLWASTFVRRGERLTSWQSTPDRTQPDIGCLTYPQGDRQVWLSRLRAGPLRSHFSGPRSCFPGTANARTASVFRGQSTRRDNASGAALAGIPATRVHPSLGRCGPRSNERTRSLPARRRRRSSLADVADAPSGA